MITGPVRVVRALARRDFREAGLWVLGTLAAPARYGAQGGLGWGGGGRPGLTWLDGVYARHDRLWRRDPYRADVELLRGAWSRWDLGPFGQLHRLGASLVFGVEAAGIWARRRLRERSRGGGG